MFRYNSYDLLETGPKGFRFVVRKHASAIAYFKNRHHAERFLTEETADIIRPVTPEETKKLGGILARVATARIKHVGYYGYRDPETQKHICLVPKCAS
jgi:hypothetical protein